MQFVQVGAVIQTFIGHVWRIDQHSWKERLGSFLGLVLIQTTSVFFFMLWVWFYLHCCYQQYACSRFNVHDSMFWCSRFNVLDSIISIQCSQFNVLDSMFSIQWSRFNDHDSIFSIQCSMFDVRFSIQYSRSTIWQWKDRNGAMAWIAHGLCVDRDQWFRIRIAQWFGDTRVFRPQQSRHRASGEFGTGKVSTAEPPVLFEFNGSINGGSIFISWFNGFKDVFSIYRPIQVLNTV